MTLRNEPDHELCPDECNKKRYSRINQIPYCTRKRGTKCKYQDSILNETQDDVDESNYNPYLGANEYE